MQNVWQPYSPSSFAEALQQGEQATKRLAADVETATAARIGPNAILQTGHALRAFGGTGFERDVFERAGLLHYLAGPPGEMIPETEAVALFNAMYQRAGLSVQEADGIARDAGSRTGDYILAHRIPRAAQRILKLLPKPLAGRALLGAIGKHSWTFAGSGAVTCRYGRPLVIEISANPLAFGTCVWHCAVFERLFRALVSRSAHAAYASRRDGAGVSTCRFEIII